VEAANDSLPDPCPPSLAGEAAFAESLALLASADIDRRRRLADRLTTLAATTGSLRDHGRALRIRSLVAMSGGDTGALLEALDDLVQVAERTGSWLYRSDAWRWRIAVSLSSGDVERAQAQLDELERVSASPLAGRAFVGTQRLLLLWARRDLDRCLELVDAMRTALAADPGAPDRRLVDLFRLVVLAEAGDRVGAGEGFDALADERGIDEASCRRYPGELALTARVVGLLGRTDAVPDVVARLEPFRGQLLVLSWGEGIVGAAERGLAELGSLLDGKVDAESFRRAAELEAAAGAHVEVERTMDAWRRTAAAVGGDGPP
jgi:hypothetical protein